MGGIKDAIHVLQDQIETALTEALPEGIFRLLEINNEGHALVVEGHDITGLVAEVSPETGTVIVASQWKYADPNKAIFMGSNACDAAGRYMAYLLIEDQ